jgi:hypothetical protein
LPPLNWFLYIENIEIDKRDMRQPEKASYRLKLQVVLEESGDGIWLIGDAFHQPSDVLPAAGYPLLLVVMPCTILMREV